MANVNQYIPLVTAAEVISNSFTNANTDPANAIKVIYKGLMNLSDSGNPSVTYNKYESTQQQNVYITNTYI